MTQDTETIYGFPFTMTIDQMIAALKKAREECGGEAPLYLMEYKPASDRYDIGVQLCVAKLDENGATVPIHTILQDELSVGFH